MAIRLVRPTLKLKDAALAFRQEFFDSGEIVGIIDLRHTLKDWLIDFGNCGNSVRPTMRGRGLATQMLKLVIERAKEVGLTELHFSTKPENKISQKTILRCGGEYERSFEYEDGIGYAYRLTLI